MSEKRSMVEETFATADPNTRVAAAVLRLIFGEAYARNFSVRLWDGTSVAAERTSLFTLGVISAGALRAAFTPPVDLHAGRAFAAGLLTVDGDVEASVDEMYSALERLRKPQLLPLLKLLLRLPKERMPALREARLSGRRHSRKRDRAAIGFHYDQPIEFYRTFLDDNLVYSCAYFDDGITSLGDAQMAKIDHILRKVRLRREERLLDIGCGWGALVVRAAKEYGAQVVGVTLSISQYEEATRRIAAAGLENRARVELWDYRELPVTTFDKIVSVGMFEHVGRDKLRKYFTTAIDLLKPGGLFLNHGIAGQDRARRGSKSSGFIERFIFPDGELVAIADALLVAERAGFEIRDVENLREHYTRTLRAWVSNIESHRDAAIAAGGEESYRAWRLYLGGSAQGFRIGRIGLFQALLAKPDADGHVPLPATRRDLYAELPAG